MGGKGEVVWIKLPPAASGGGPPAAAATALSAFDSLTAVTSTMRVWAIEAGTARLEALTLQQALTQTVADLPFLAGRLARKKGRLRLGSYFIAHTGKGAELSIVDRPDVSLVQLGPDSWPWEQQWRMGDGTAVLPFYLPHIDTRPRALLRGKEPLMKVRLTRLADGDILALSLAHVICDGMHFPQLSTHLAARYRQCAPSSGTLPDPSELVRPTDRTLLSLEHFKREFGLEQWQPPASIRVCGSLGGYWRLARGLLARRRQRAQLLVLFVPREAVAVLKAVAAGDNPKVTTGDSVQAAATLLLHAAAGLPQLPVAPKAMSIMLQMPTPPGYFGNSVRMLPVSLPAGTAQPAEGDWAGALRQLAGAIRSATAAFRSSPEEKLLALAEAEAFAGAPLPRLLAHLASRYLPLLTATTNFVPVEQGIDLGLGRPPAFTRQLSRPVAAGMATLRPSQPPYAAELLRTVVIRPSGKSGKEEQSTPLSAPDGLVALTAIGRAVGYPTRIDERALEAALQATVTDLPFLAGRLARTQNMRLGTLAIQHTGDGVPFTVVKAPDVRLSCMEAQYLGGRMTITAPTLPFYLEHMDVGRRLLRGQEPLMRIRLTRCADGDILACTFAHCLADGTRWPLLAAHLAARYREKAGGSPADPSELLRPTDRTLLSVEHMAPLLLGKGASYQPPQLQVRGSLGGYLRLAALIGRNATQSMQLVVLHLPQEQIAALKKLAAGGNPAVTTGDAVQAVAALIMHAASGRPLLPVAPKSVAVVVQLPSPPGYFGNGTRMLPVRLPAGTEQPAAGDWEGALRQLAGAMRQAIATFRTQPEEALAALADSEALAGTPVLRMLSYLAATRLPHITCSTNYVPAQLPLDLGLGKLPTVDQELTLPLARGMAVIRPAQPPFAGGLFLRLCLKPKDAARLLRGHELLAALLPQARWVTGG